MSGAADFLAGILILAGMILMLAGTLGLLRLPDFYARTHAVSKSDTVGIVLVILGLMVHAGWTQTSLKLALIVIFIALANPIGAHALARAAFERGLKPLGSSSSHLEAEEEETKPKETE